MAHSHEVLHVRLQMRSGLYFLGVYYVCVCERALACVYAECVNVGNLRRVWLINHTRKENTQKIMYKCTDREHGCAQADLKKSSSTVTLARGS